MFACKAEVELSGASYSELLCGKAPGLTLKL